MPLLLNRVQPGDVITAERWNLAIDAINQLLLARPVSGALIAVLSPAGTSAEPLRVGTILQISGQHFGYSTGQTRVLFEGPFGAAEVRHSELLPGSADNRLLLRVPAIPTLTTAGMTVTLRVDSGVSQDLRSVFVMPVVINVAGDLAVNWRAGVNPNPNPNPLVENQSATFALEIKSDLNMPATVSLEAAIVNASVAVPAGLEQSIEFQRADGSAIAGRSLDMATQETRPILVRIPQLPSSFRNQSFTLKVTATAGRVQGEFSQPFTVNTAVQAPDSNIRPTLTGSMVLDSNDNTTNNPANGVRSGTTLKLKKGFQMIVMYNVELAGPSGTYDATIQPKAGTTVNGWSATFTSDTTTPLQGPTPAGQPAFVKLLVTPSGTAPAQNGVLVFRIRRQGASTDWFQEFNVELLP